MAASGPNRLERELPAGAAMRRQIWLKCDRKAGVSCRILLPAGAILP